VTEVFSLLIGGGGGNGGGGNGGNGGSADMILSNNDMATVLRFVYFFLAHNKQSKCNGGDYTLNIEQQFVIFFYFLFFDCL
jgi:hypothetical protein